MSTLEQKNSSLIERLFSAGAHFGFTKSRRHPTVTPYIFANKQGTDIFDLEQTAVLFENAKQILKEAGEQGKTVMYVGTKNEISKIVEQYGKKAEMPIVVNRWIGGMLTNFSEMRKRIERLKSLVAERESGELERKYIKKERVVIGREVAKLEFNFGGIQHMDKMPHMLIVVDPRHDHIAVEEATFMKIPVIGIMSSDCDVSKITTPVVVNDALKSSVTLALDELTSAFLEGKKSFVPAPARTVSSSRPSAPRGAHSSRPAVRR
jgi:small subunit ribosomal protein S2